MNTTLTIICWNGRLWVVNNYFYIDITFFFLFLTHNIPLQPIIIKVTSKPFFFSFFGKTYIYYYLKGFSYLESSFVWFKNALTPLYLSKDKTKGQFNKNITLTPAKTLPKK